MGVLGEGRGGGVPSIPNFLTEKGAPGGGGGAYHGWIQDPAVPTTRPWGPAGARGDLEGEIPRRGRGEAAVTPPDTTRSRRRCCCCRRHYSSFAASNQNGGCASERRFYSGAGGRARRGLLLAESAAAGWAWRLSIGCEWGGGVASRVEGGAEREVGGAYAGGGVAWWGFSIPYWGL